MLTAQPFSRRTRNALLSVHIVTSVALLGDVLALAAVTIKASGDDPAGAETAYEIMSMFSLTFGIPLSFGALLTGVALGLGTRWGVLRYPWVIGKLLLTIGVILAGALVIGPAEGELLRDSAPEVTRESARARVVVAGALQVTALVAAVFLAVYKPGRRRGASPGQTHLVGSATDAP